jgi:predicted Zn finger-like uncharacterized protein
MFTVCPKCSLTLTVTAADLRVAQGFVRCGQCSNVFNALSALSDERQTAPAPAAAPQEPSPDPEPAGPGSALAAESPASTQPEAAHEHPPRAMQSMAPPDEGAALEDAGSALEDERSRLEVEGSALDDEGSPLTDDDSIEQTSLEFNPAAADVSQIFIEPQMIADSEVTGTYESIVLGSHEPAAAEVEEIEAIKEAARTADEELNAQLQSLAARIDAARQNELAQSPTGLQPLFEPLDALRREPRLARPRLWTAGLVGLALLLVAQIVNHYRDDLAVNTSLHRPLTALYAAFGVALVPRWDLSAYEVHQLGASAATQASGELTVRASVKNDAGRPQPLPLLRVTLLDRFGNRLASRDVPPRAYLGAAAAADALLPAGERVDAQMAFVDPGRAAVGFEIDACLPTLSAQVHCANDAAAK